MSYTAKEFSLKGLDGISDEQLSQHIDVLYAGYVKKLNEIREKLKAVDLSSANQVYSELRALKVEESFAMNGVVLHELYFENLGGNGSLEGGALKELIAKDFGSFERWQEEFKACAMAARGWVVLGMCMNEERLVNWCLDTHSMGLPAGLKPVLVIDVYEHAYMIDYGVKRPPYIDAFMRNINWQVCEGRLARVSAS
ncbi:MAG TPA: superoxide dismutase [Deltaproteobacteria bacterium]|nr:superoxide dismutase [Deltaproteobacteria bacterium]